MILETLALVSTSIAAGWVWSRVFISKRPKRKTAAEVDQELARLELESAPLSRRQRVIHCDDPWKKGWNCPYCSRGWHSTGITLCDCDLVRYHHSHYTCKVADSDPSYKGCKGKYIILAHTAPKDYQPYEIVVPEEKTKETAS
jgi:hypothetical protein